MSLLSEEHYAMLDEEGDSPRHQYIEDYYAHNPRNYKANKIDKIKVLNSQERNHVKRHIDQRIERSLSRQLEGLGRPPPSLERKYMRGRGKYQAGQDSRGRWFLKDIKGRFVKWRK